MKSEKPIFYTVSELFEQYNLTGRRWSEKDIEHFVFTDIIIGTYDGISRPKNVRVEKESFEAFLEYHNKHLCERSRRVMEGIENSENQKDKDT